MQDEITVKVMTALHVKLQAGDHVQVLGSGTKNLDAFLKAIEAREHMYRYTKEDNAMARKLYEEVIILDPRYALGYLVLKGEPGLAQCQELFDRTHPWSRYSS